MQKKVAVLNDLSGLGRCSLSAAIPIVSALGVQVCPVPTALLTNQTGYASYYIDDCSDNIQHYTEEWQKLNFKPDGIYTGFFSNTVQVDKAEDFIRTFRGSDTLLVVDPVMADAGKLYDTFSASLCKRISNLASRANIITPNYTEFCILAGVDYNELLKMRGTEGYLERIYEAGKKLLNDTLTCVIVTGIFHNNSNDSTEKLYNAVICKDECFSVKSDVFGNYYSGTGDIFSSIVCGCVVRGESIRTAVELAVKFLSTSIKQSFENGVNGNDGIEFESCLGMLTKQNRGGDSD